MVSREIPASFDAGDDYALLATLVLLFSFKGETILNNPLTILWIAIPLFLQTVLIFALGYGLSKAMRLTYENAAPTAMIGASNHFEVAIATSTMLYGLSSGAALATVVGVLIEVPLMLMPGGIPETELAVGFTRPRVELRRFPRPATRRCKGRVRCAGKPAPGTTSAESSDFALPFESGIAELRAVGSHARVRRERRREWTSAM